jgi:cell division protein FtsQ
VHQPAAKEKLKQRRRQLRQQRQIRVAKSLWRFVWMNGIFAGTVWGASQADWMISKPGQVRIEGNQYLSEAKIRSMLAIPYPAMIMELAPDQLVAKLVEKGSIADAKIDRGLLPPHLTVQIQDLPPVARIVRDENTERGQQLPISSYRATIWKSLPKLQLRPPDQGSCPDWNQIYQAIQASSVAIGIIDCRNPQNLILQTELGKIRIGAIGDKARLNNQLHQLDRLRDWQKYTNPADVDYLDLENPDSPKLQLKQPGPTTSIRS